MAKKIVAVVKIQLEAGGATPAPPVGTALGPHGIQTMEFCKQYNAATESMRGTVIPVDISIYEDRSFTFVLKTPPTPVLLRQAAGVAKGAHLAGRETVASVTMDQIEEIAKTKLKDLNTDDLEMAKLPSRGHRPLHGHLGRGLGEETMKHGKNYKNALAQVDREELLTVSEALDKVKNLATAKFDETVELAIRLGVDPRKAEQIVRGTHLAARGHRQDQPRGGLRRRRGRPGRP